MSDQWTIGPVADRIGIIAVGLSMIVPLTVLIWRVARYQKARQQ